MKCQYHLPYCDLAALRIFRILQGVFHKKNQIFELKKEKMEKIFNKIEKNGVLHCKMKPEGGLRKL